jgi:hypothetical protein
VQRELEDLVAERLELASVNRRQIFDACDKVATVTWPRLPLYTDVALDGEPLQRFLKVRCDLDLEAFVAVYEEFVAGYLLTHELSSAAPIGWLTRQLGLSGVDAAQLFSDGSPRRGRRASGPRELTLITVALAALANYTYGGLILYDDPVRFAVNVPGDRVGFDFGVMEGKPITNLGKGGLGPRVRAVRHHSRLVHAGRQRAAVAEASSHSVFCQLQALGRVAPDIAGDSEGWNLALAILRHRARGNQPKRLVRAIADRVDPVGFKQALRLAAGFQEFDYPHQQLKLLLCPAYVKPEQFRELFGLSPRNGLTPQRAQEWRLALDHLSDSIKEGIT